MERMPACEECHRAKVKCDQGRPCSRCVQLGVECVERISRQGQGPKRRRKRPPLDGALTANTTTTTVAAAREEGQEEEPDSLNPNSEDGRVLSAMMEFGQFHYGVRYLIHSWTSFAFARRSFSLLSRASRLAAKSGVPMDEIYCLERRDVLDPILYKYPTTTTATTHDMKKKPRPPLDWKELPPALLQVLDAENPSSRQNRLLMVREARNGQSRYLVTDEFQQQIASLWLLEQTWKANTMPVVQIFLEGPEDFDKFNNSIRYSLSRYTHPNKKPECVRMNTVRVKQQQQNNISSIRTMDLLYAFEIVNLEHSFYIVELVDSTAVHSSGSSTSAETIAGTHQSTSTTATTATTTTTTTTTTTATTTTCPLQMFGNLVPSEEMDTDFEAFLELLKD